MREERARRLLGRLLRLYPASFRLTLGDDLIETALHRRRDALREWPRTGEARFWSTEGMRFVLDGALERVRSLPSIADELRHAGRQVKRARSHHALAIVTLALGIGATTTMFTIADAVVFRPLPYPDAESLYLIHARFGTMELSSNSLANVRDLQSSVRSMSWLAAAHDRSPALTDGAGDAERVSVLDVTAQYLPGLGARVQYGRGFAASDFAAGAERVAIVSAALWQQRWARGLDVVGRSMQLDGVAHTVVGVMGRDFRDPEPIESGALTGVWVPVRAGAFRHRDDFGFRVLARLAGGSTIESARAELDAAGAQLSEAYPTENSLGSEPLGFILHPLRELTVGDARARVLLLLGAVGLLLLLSCANVANLFLARGVTRAAELDVRSTLGATPGRLALQLFTESVLTAAIAAVAGGLLGVAGMRAFVTAAPAGIPRLHEVGLDVRALAFVAVLTAVTAVLFGSVPALRGARTATASSAGARITTSLRTQRVQATLVSAEVALSLVLVTGAALLLNSFRHMLTVAPGFDGADVMVVDVRPPTTSHAEDVLFYAMLLERARSLPGVRHAALIHSVPGSAGGAWSRATIDAAMNQPAPAQRAVAPAYRLDGADPGNDFVRINPVYGSVFETLDMLLLAGRDLSHNPHKGEPLVVVINEAAAQRLFPDVERPLGRQLALGTPGSNAALREVIGIVADVRQRGAAHEAEPQIYVPYAQRDIDRLSLVLETTAGATVTVDALRQLVRGAAPGVPVDRVDALSARYAGTADGARFLTFLLTVFALTGLVLAVVGTYATASHAMLRRVRELGIRIALGARTDEVLRLMLTRALTSACAGIAAGLLITLALTRFLESYLFGISARDPFTFAVAAIVIATCAALASLGPALRAARVDPNEVLRSAD